MTVPQVPLIRLLRQRHGTQVVSSATYPMAGVFGFGKGLIFRESIQGSDTKYTTLTRLTSGNVVYSKVKAFEGAITIVPPAGCGRFVSPEFPVFSISEAVIPEYLGHFFGWQGFIDQLRGESSGIGARRERVHPTVLLGMNVPLPALPEQRRIAVHLDDIHRCINNMTFRRRDSRKPIESALKHLSWDTPLRNLLQEDLDEIDVKSNMEYRQIGVFGKGRGVIDRGAFLGSDTKYKKMLRVREGQVVLSRLKAFEGAVAVVPAHHDGALVSREFPTFTMDADVDPLFVQAILMSTPFEESMRSQSIGLGARRERIGALQFLSINVPAPALDVQRIVGRAAQRASRVRALQLQSEVLGHAILPAARNEVFSALL